MIKVFELFEKYILEKLPQITFVSLTIVFFINAFYNIALLTDGTFNFANILLDILWNEKRFFATFIVNLPMILAIKLGSTDFNLFILLQGFWFFFVTLICLFIAYINMPEKNKDSFQFILLSYLISMNFVGTFFSNKSFICAGLYWIIAVILVFEDFNTISYKKLFLLLICSILMIKNYEWSAVFALLFIIYYIFKIKNINTYISFYKKTLIYTVLLMFFLSISFLTLTCLTETEFLIYISKNPIDEILYDYQLTQALIVIFFIIMIIFLSFKKNINKFVNFVLFLCFCCLLLMFINYNFLHSIASYRLFNFFIPLIFSLILYYLYNNSNIFINFKIIKLLNFILLVLFIFNISVIAQKWNKSIDNLFTNLQINDELIINAEEYPLFLQEGHHLHFWLSIIIQKQRGIDNIKTLFYPFPPKPLAPLTLQQQTILECNQNLIPISKDNLPNLKKFGITYSDELLKKIEENSKLNPKISENLRYMGEIKK